MINVLVWIALCLSVGFAGSWATLPEIAGWYQEIQKPLWNPPNWIFGPVWTTLYVLMGIAASRIWNKRKEVNVRLPLTLFGVQLFLNLCWSLIFFRAHMLLGALIEVAVLWAAIFLTAKSFWKIDRAAGYLLLPYLMWVSFAGFLNFVIWRIN